MNRDCPRGSTLPSRQEESNRYLGGAVQQWVFCSLQRSAWARQFYDSKIATGQSHHTVLRALRNRWLEILWHCLRLGVTYDEKTHTTNQQRHLAHAA